MNWMLMLDIIMTIMAIWLAGHIVVQEYLLWKGYKAYVLMFQNTTFGQRLGSFKHWWYGLSVLTIIYFVVRLFG